MLTAKHEIVKKLFGTLSDGRDVSLFVLDAGEFKAAFTDWGATWTSLIAPDSHGRASDVLLGFSTLSGYTAKHPFFGSTVGRFANRIGGAQFSMDGKEYQLFANNNQNHLHGGKKGFDKYLWNYELSTINGDPAVQFSRVSPDGEEGYPGTLTAKVTVSLSTSGSLRLQYAARSDAKTPLNLTNHAYFNLAGEGRGSILGHTLQLHASSYLAVDSGLIPTGEIATAKRNAYDFSLAKAMGKDIAEVGGGYDFCYIIDSAYLPLKPFATVSDPGSGRTMTVSTTLPAVQFYTGNNLTGLLGKGGSIYDKYSGFCLETQMFPDSPNKPGFPSPFIAPGEIWEHETVYTFNV